MSLVAPTKRTQEPICTGSSVLGVCYEDGVVIAADNLVSFGRFARYRNFSRLFKVNETTVAGCSGDFADYQYLHGLIEQKQIDIEANEESKPLSARALHSWLTRVLYNRRSKIDPLWTSWVVGGLDEGEPFLGFVDKLGTAYKEKIISTGFGAYIALPLMRKYLEERNNKLTKEEAIDLIKKCMSLLFVRDCSAHNIFEMAVVDKNGAQILGPFNVEANWSELGIHRGNHKTRAS